MTTSAIPDKQEITRLLQKYAPNDEMFELIKTHGEVVAEIALWCAANVRAKDPSVKIDLLRLETACLLHDIGSYVFLAAMRFDTTLFRKSYTEHAIFGAKILQDEGVDEQIWQAVETHIMLGLTPPEIERAGLRLPAHDYRPRTIEAELLCYADRFHSKDPKFNTYESYQARLEKDLPHQVIRMGEMSKRFGIPDVAALAAKYGHPAH